MAGPQALASRLDTTEAVARALRAVARECFLPARIWVQETDDGPYAAIDRATEPQRWMRAVYVGDHAIVTQFDDGATQWPDRGWRPSCSASQPSVVAGMLEALDIVVPTTPRSDHYLTRQAGPRRLWDEAATAYQWWDEHGRPPIEAWQ